MVRPGVGPSLLTLTAVYHQLEERRLLAQLCVYIYLETGSLPVLEACHFS